MNKKTKDFMCESEKVMYEEMLDYWERLATSPIFSPEKDKHERIDHG